MRNVVILGMHRSGTSMVAGALASLGVYAGESQELLCDQEDNPNGFWERCDVVEFNDKVLQASSAQWFQPGILPVSPPTEKTSDLSAIMSRLSEGTPVNQSWLLKDPRMVVTWPAWEATVADAVVVYVYRSPLAVATSLSRRNGFPLSMGLALWEYYNQTALAILEGKNAISISFDNLINDPASGIYSLADQLRTRGVACDPSEYRGTFDTTLVRSKVADDDLVVSLLTPPQRQLLEYCEALCAGDTPLPSKPTFSPALLGAYLKDQAAAFAPLARVVETEQERDALSRLIEERTYERDESLAQLSSIESEFSALAQAHGVEVDLHRDLEVAYGLQNEKHTALAQEHTALAQAHMAEVDLHRELEVVYHLQREQREALEYEHDKLNRRYDTLMGKAEYLFGELSGTYKKLLEFEYSFQGGILRFIRRVYKFLRGRRGTTSLYDDALGDARVHFDQHVTDSDEVPGIGGRVPGKLSLFSSVLKYVVKNPAGSVRSFSLVRLKRATAVFLKSDADDLDVWVSSRFPKTSNTNSAQNAVDPNNLDPKLDGTELEFPFYAQPAISIVIPVYNDYRMTMYCLTALLENTHGVTYEVIVGDDCSTDLTVSIAERVSNVTIVRNDNNVGFVENCRAGAAIARGDHILFLNNDTGVCENWLAPLLEVLQDDESVGIVGPKLLFGDGRLQEAGGIVWQDGSAWNFGRMDNPDKPEYNFLREVDYISGACLLIRGTLWQQLGGFDQRYIPAYYEDTDIAFAAREVGYKVVYQPLSRVFHFEGVSNGTDLEAGTKKYQVSNHKKFLHKWREQLESFHFPNAESVFQARDRSRHKRCVMFVDHYVPHYDKDAGSRSTFMYVQLMLDMGYKVIFLGANYFPHTPYTETLQQMGVEVLVGEYMARNQDKWLKENAPYIDRIYLHRPHIAEQLLDSLERMKPKPPIIFFGHDLHYLRTQREQDVTADITLAKAAQKWQEREYAVFDRVDKIYYPSQIEVDEIHSKRPNLDVRAIPLYVLPVTDSQAYVSGARSDLLFVGGFNHPPNVDGISWFVAEVLPLVEAQCPGIKLHIVGSNANDVVMSLATDTVIVHGYLSDQALNELYAQVRQAIVPLRYGAGVKGKVLEAIQKNVPLVTTTVGAEGIPAAETVMNIADTAVGFAAKIVSIESGDQALLGKLDEYTSWLGNNFSAENARKIILEDFGNPDRRQ